MQNLQPSQPNISQSQTDSISIYKGALTTQGWIKGLKLIKLTFPTLFPGFHDVLAERLKANGFSNERFLDSVNHVIDTCTYPTPTIADFISFDRKIKTYTYGQYCDLCDQGDGRNYAPVRLDNMPKPVWIHVNDISKYGLKELVP